MPRIIIGPPGVGKTTLQEQYPDRMVDVEESISWKRVAAKKSLYHFKERRIPIELRLEWELDWPSIWLEDVWPRLWAAFHLQQDVTMGLITPTNAELVSRFLSAFASTTTLLLPPESTHWQRVWQHATRRPRTWGSELMGWQNTYWIRLLLQGLASDLSIPIQASAARIRPSRVRSRPTPTREVRMDGPRGSRKFFEVWRGTWAEVDMRDQIVAMYDAEDLDSGVRLTCNALSISCHQGTHDCGQVQTFEKDSSGQLLSEWIATDKWRPASKSQKNAILFFVGTLAPFHGGHLDALNAAKKHLESKGFHVRGGYASTFAQLKEGRVGDLEDVLGSGTARTVMLQLGVSQSDWLMPDAPIDHVLRSGLLKNGTHPVQRVAQRLRARGLIGKTEEVTTFWMNGKDAVMDPTFFSAFAAQVDQDVKNPLRMLILDNRPGPNAWSRAALQSQVPELIPFVSQVVHHRSISSSATAVREALRTANREALRQLIQLPLVEAYLLGKMYQRTVRYEPIDKNPVF